MNFVQFNNTMCESYNNDYYLDDVVGMISLILSILIIKQCIYAFIEQEKRIKLEITASNFHSFMNDLEIKAPLLLECDDPTQNIKLVITYPYETGDNGSYFYFTDTINPARFIITKVIREVNYSKSSLDSMVSYIFVTDTYDLKIYQSMLKSERNNGITHNAILASDDHLRTLYYIKNDNSDSDYEYYYEYDEDDNEEEYEKIYVETSCDD